MIHTWDDIRRLAYEEPALHQYLTLVERGDLTRQQAMTEALFWYVQALQSCRAQLLDAEARRPRIYYLDAKGIQVRG
jgi:hypothetical protein